MKLKIINSIGIITVHIFTIGLLMNSLYPIAAICSSIVYIVSMTYLLYKGTTNLIDSVFSFSYTLFMIVVCSLGFHMRYSVNILTYWLFPIFIAVSPFSGLSYISGLSDYFLSLLPFLVSTIWFSYQCYHLFCYIRSLRKNEH